MPHDHLRSLIDFITASPTSYHAVSAMAAAFDEAGHREMDERLPWSDVPALGYVRRDGALIAWRQPTSWSAQTGLRIVAAHTDSPALKLKPGGTFSRAGFQLANVEVYGDPILHTWFDRDLAIAGRLATRDGAVRLVRTEPFLRVPTLAIHLDRDVNSSLKVDAQRDLTPLFTLARSTEASGELEAHLANLAGLDVADVAGHDLFLVPVEPPALIGLAQDLLASYRLDNLLSVHSGMAGMLAAEQGDDVQIFVAFDHEEVGSGTPSGASGPFLIDLLRRLSLARDFTEDAHLAWLRRGCALSADVAHGVHPNRPDRYDQVTRPVLNGGPVLKWSAPMRYTTDAPATAYWARACAAAGLDHQIFVNNNTVRGGASLGPLLATRLGIRSVDGGIAVVSMHSARELCGAADPARFARLTSAFLEAL